MAVGTIPARYTNAILNSMAAGVVPNIGLEYIHVGRKQEVNAILADLNNIAQGAGAFRIIEGQYGSGKSFLLQLARNNAMQRGYLVADVDLSPERRLAGTKGQGLKMYRELIGHLSTKARPNGNAMESLLQAWILSIQNQLNGEGIMPESPNYDDTMYKRLHMTASAMQEYIYGYDLGRVLMAYWEGYRKDDDELKQAALRWLRGEYDRLTDAKRLLGVQQIIKDDTWYEFVKLLARLSTRLGYKGLLVLIDEEVNLYKITNRVSRENNYEKLLSIFNDIMQGRAEYIGVYLGGTVQSVEDTSRGLFSYAALQSRLQTSHLVRAGMTDFSGPIIRLKTLTMEEIYLLLERLQEVFCAHHKLKTPLLSQSELMTFMATVSERIGADKLLTPREVTRDFITLLNLLHQNANETFESIMQSGQVSFKTFDTDPDGLDDEAFAEFDL